MEMLSVAAGKIVDQQQRPRWLRGVCIGGWMNLENFINGYPGAAHTLRAVMDEILGKPKAHFFFERLMDYMFNEEDIAFIKSTGATVIRLPLNYRHFEDDAQPFVYKAAGFARLEQVVRWCTQHDLYIILDLHAVAGWQNPDWHSDNANRHALFWDHPHFQDRFVALWEEIARRYAGNATIAGYNLMNEPVSNAPNGVLPGPYVPNWGGVNAIYRRTVQAIRAIDTQHLIFLEGDLFSQRFRGLDAPFADGLVYSSHNYLEAGFGPGPYPGEFGGMRWDQAHQAAHFLAQEGTQFSRQHHVPLWVGEFGSVYNGSPAEVSDRVRSLADQLLTFDQHEAHWTMWTYKDVGVMGWLKLHPESNYLRTIAPVLEAKKALLSDFWMQWLPHTPILHGLDDVADAALHASNIAADKSVNRVYFRQAALDNYVGRLLQPLFAQCFADLSETEIDHVLQDFSRSACLPNADVITLVRQHCALGAPENVASPEE